jgi:hypothetical protein
MLTNPGNFISIHVTIKYLNILNGRDESKLNRVKILIVFLNLT